jgi:glycosyltransferase involved in cell wall biosynthesis
MTRRASALSSVSNLVSIVIPCYNRSRLLPQTIASCALQTWRDLEVIVVDDGSEEDLETVVAEVRQQYGFGEHLKYVRQPHRGAGSARNFGTRMARGDFIQFLDSDDLLHPEKLERQLEQLRARPELDMVFCVDEQFRERPGDMRLLWNVPKRVDCADDLDRFLLEDSVWHTGSPLWRRRAINRVGQWNEDLLCWQDWEFHTGALCTGIRYECTPTILQYIRHHDGPRVSWSQLAAEDRERVCLCAGVLARDHLMEAGLFDAGKTQLLYLYFLRHLTALAWINADTAALRAELIDVLAPLASSHWRRYAFGVMRQVRSRFGFRKLLGIYLRLTKLDTPYRSLRNIVLVFAESVPPPALIRLVEAGAAHRERDHEPAVASPRP